MERRGADWLRRRGLREVARNHRCRLGEVDLIALDGEALVFVEVRYRARGGALGAAASVDYKKQGRIRAAARHFLMGHPEHAGRLCRFDVLALRPAERDTRWIKNAFC